MCNLSDLIVERTEKEVTAKETVQSVTNLMENLQWSLEKNSRGFPSSEASCGFHSEIIV